MESAWQRSQLESKSEVRLLKLQLCERDFALASQTPDVKQDLSRVESLKAELQAMRKDFISQQKYSLKLKTENHSLRRSLQQTLQYVVLMC